MSGTLYIISTPIGNLEDITYRAVRILADVDLIAAEDTRHSMKLLNHFNISKPLTSYFDHNQQFKGERILNALQLGKSVALISDAGTPCISDPGFNLVRDAVNAGIKVVPIPGACAATTALSASGLPSDIFTFAGFAPSKAGKRRSFLSEMSQLPGTLILYEAPHRLEATLRDIHLIFSGRKVVIARELTKIYEEFIRGEADLLADAVSKQRLRGELVILIEPGTPIAKQLEPFEETLRRMLHEDGLTVKDASKKVAGICGVSKNEAYALALEIKKEQELI